MKSARKFFDPFFWTIFQTWTRTFLSTELQLLFDGLS